MIFNKYRLYLSKAALLTIVFFLAFQINTQSSFAEEFVLPFKGEVEINSDPGAFSVKNTGNGFAGNFELTKEGNSNPALQGRTNGAGPAVKARATGSGASLDSVTTGSGSAGKFQVFNTKNNAPAIRASTDGTGPAASFDGDVLISEDLKGTNANFDGDANISGNLSVKQKLLGAAQSADSSPLRICAGKTQPGATNWKPYNGGTQGIQVDVDTKACDFKNTPIYIVNLHGNSFNWETSGGSSPYPLRKNGFRIFVRFSSGRTTPLTPVFANNNKWHIQWIALGD